MSDRSVYDGVSPYSAILQQCSGRERDVLQELIRAFATGCNVSPKFVPGMSVYICRLRKRGVAIATTFRPAKWAKGRIVAGYDLMFDAMPEPERGV